MQEINIGQVIIENRHKRGITQEELAEHIGVSKTAVSKWETSATYPDILLLPRLAAYFNITLDELMDYRPQMSQKEIRKLCEKLAREFSEEPFDQVMGRCREIVQEYFSCTDLLLQLACLWVNHCFLAGTTEKALQILEEARKLFVRVKQESNNASLVDQAAKLEGYCLLNLGRPQEAIDLLEANLSLRLTPEPLLAEGYQRTERPEKAKQVLQAGIYQSLLELVNLLLSYISLCRGESLAFEETIRRTLSLTKSFQLDALHPTLAISIYLSIAQEYALCGQQERALEFLERYQVLALSDIYPVQLHGDAFFDLLEDWLEETLPLGSNLPKEETVLRKSIYEALSANPAFARLAEDPRFQKIVSELNMEGRNHR